MNSTPATEPQIKFLTTLTTERVIPAHLSTAIAGGLDKFTKRAASDAISALLNAPRVPKATTPAPASPWAEVTAALAAIPTASYAIPGDLAETAMTGYTVTNDYLFVEVVKRGKRYFLNRLHGAPGGFSTTSLSTANQLALAKLIAGDALRYSQEFGSQYSRCGKCRAELTDEKSRFYNLGPHCRKAFGITD